MALVRWNQNRNLPTIEDEFNQMFRNFWGGRLGENILPEALGFLPPVDVEESRDFYLVSVELPGLTQKDVKVSVIDNALVIKGEKRGERDLSTKDRDEEQGEPGYRHRVERTYGRFERIIQLATKVDRDKISATMKDGVLTIQVPKTEEAREREINVEVK